MGGKPSWQVTYLPNLVALGTVVLEINDFRLTGDLRRPRDEKIILFYAQEPMKKSLVAISTVVVKM